MKSKLLKKYLLIGISVAISFFVIGSLTNHFLMTFDRRPPPHHRPPIEKRFGDHKPRKPKRPGLAKVLGVQILAITFSVGVTIFIIFTHFKGRTKEIESVLERIKNGDLQARMPDGNRDEFGLAMGKFNDMADEIERLVNQLRKTESTRRVLLGELAHDIRTPLASVGNLLEILKGEKYESLNKEQRNDMLSMSLNEVHYISNLVEDLLFLGKIEEPSYKRDNTKQLLGEIIEEISCQVSTQYPEISFSSGIGKDVSIEMDAVLLSRLIRNALENSFSFAESKVEVQMVTDEKYHYLQIKDDGPGVTKEVQSTFGVKKFSRTQEDNSERISVGLGSVIMKSIIESYGGILSIQNNEDKGAKVSIAFLKNP